MTTTQPNKYIYFIKVSFDGGDPQYRGTRTGAPFRNKSNAKAALNRQKRIWETYYKSGNSISKWELATFELTEIKDQELFVGLKVRRINFPDQIGSVVEVRPNSRFPYVVHFDEGYDVAYKLGEIELCV